MGGGRKGCRKLGKTGQREGGPTQLPVPSPAPLYRPAAPHLPGP